jgi:DNA invertase Pin-like site-specific DNA recombinase
MRAAIYIRVSTQLQEKKYSLAAQHTELNKYAESQGWIIVGEFKDVDSGGKLDKKGLNALLDVVEEGRIDVVLCIDQDRLSRLDTIAWEYLKSTLRDNGVKIAEPGHIVDLDNEDEEFISDIKNLIAKREKKAIVRRMMRGKRQRMREGKGWGKPPFEYYYDKSEGQYKLDDNWSWVIPFIDDLYLHLQYGMVTISNMLNQIARTPTGNLWNEHLVSTRIMTKAYHGVMEKTYANGETISIDGIYPAIRTKETWEKLQEERIKRGTQYKATSRQRNKLHILRRTYITCGVCGRKINLAMHGTREQPRYYLKHERKLKLRDETVCDMSVNTIRFEKNIIQAIKDILSGEELAKKYLDLDYDHNEVELLRKQIANNEKTITSLQNKLDKLLDLFLEGRFSKDSLTKKQTEIENELSIITKQTEQLNAKYEVLQNNSFSYDFVYELMELAEGFDTEFTPLEQAQIMGNLFPQGVLYPDYLLLKAELKGVPIDVRIPIDPDPFTWHHSKKAPPIA